MSALVYEMLPTETQSHWVFCCSSSWIVWRERMKYVYCAYKSHTFPLWYYPMCCLRSFLSYLIVLSIYMALGTLKCFIYTLFSLCFQPFCIFADAGGGWVGWGWGWEWEWEQVAYGRAHTRSRDFLIHSEQSQLLCYTHSPPDSLFMRRRCFLSLFSCPIRFWIFSPFLWHCSVSDSLNSVMHCCEWKVPVLHSGLSLLCLLISKLHDLIDCFFLSLLYF